MQDLKRRIIEAGGTPRQVENSDARTRQKVMAETAERFDSTVSVALRNRIWKALGYLAVFFTVVFVLFGNIAVMILFPIAEYDAIRAGILAFGSTAARATLYSATLIIGYVVMLFIKDMLEGNLPSGVAPKTTLRHSYKALRFYLGLEKQAPQRLRVEERYLQASSAVFFFQFTIVFLGVLGRIAGVVDTDVAYYAALKGIAVDSSLLEAMGYVGTVGITVALLKATDFIVGFVYDIFVSIVGNMELGKNDPQERETFFTERFNALRAESLELLALKLEARQAQEA